MQHVVIYMYIGGCMFQVVPKTCRQDSQHCVLLLACLPPNFGDFCIGPLFAMARNVATSTRGNPSGEKAFSP